MSALPPRSTMTVEEYFALDESSSEVRYEYIDGHVTMLAGGTLDHSLIGANIITALRNALRGTPCRVFTTDARIELTSRRYVYPDVSVSCDERDRGRIKNLTAPRLVIEVLSPNTERYDRGRKFAFYRDCPTIQEYVLIEPDYPSVETYRRERGRLWVLRTFGEGDEIELVSVGIHFPISAIYEDVIFPPDEDEPA